MLGLSERISVSALRTIRSIVVLLCQVGIASDWFLGKWRYVNFSLQLQLHLGRQTLKIQEYMQNNATLFDLPSLRLHRWKIELESYLNSDCFSIEVSDASVGSADDSSTH